MSESWKPVVGYEGLYEVSDKGNVRSMERTVRYKDGRTFSYPQRTIKLQEVLGYPSITLSREGRRRSIWVHRLVAEAFIPVPDGKTEVNHKDGDKWNCSVGNLEWVTRSENIKHAYDNGLRKSQKKEKPPKVSKPPKMPKTPKPPKPRKESRHMLNNMKHHPLVRTSQDIRRSIVRLQAFVNAPVEVPVDERNYANNLIKDLRMLHDGIPEQYRDKDLQREV